MRPFGFPILLICPLLLSACGLVKLPVRVVGAVAEGTARAGKKVYDASAEAMTKSPEEKAAEAKEKSLEEAREKKAAAAAETKASPEATPGLETPPLDPVESADYLPPLPGTSEPLPDDLPLPYQPD